MYRRDATAIQQLVAERGAEGLRDVCLFVVATIRQQFPVACRFTRAALAGDAEAKRKLAWGFKQTTLDYLDDHAEAIHAECQAAGGDAHAVMAALLRIPGLGLAKAGFVAQLAYGVSGCIDSHNARRYNVPAATLRWSPKLSAVTAGNRIAAYLDLIEACGGTERLWDSWCTYLAEKSPRTYPGGADQVSAMHALAVIG